MSMRQKDIGILIKILSERYVAKNWIGEVTGSVVLNEALLE